MPTTDDRLKAVFDQAAELPNPAARAAFLDRACGADATLRGRVEALLRAHDAVGSFLVHPPAPPVAAGAETASFGPDADTRTAAWAGPAPAAGTVVAGRYKLLEPIGEGGMGTVWMAEQTDPVERRVAVKLVKPGMDSRQVVARFEAERQALALMDHPNIAKILDGGATADGQPFFAMELVKGTPITKYCDDHRLPIRERLTLFADVCRAVQHAHQKGVIHRDLKPSNVLVAPYDGRPVVKVIDFGVAKATGRKLTDATLFTGFGAVLGTPEYMSPEQAELNNADIDTRSDVYALGVVLYELLTGTTPLTRKRVKEAALLELLKLVREEEPPRPSTRLSTTAELPSIAAVRGVEPARLPRQVRGELDWIVMRCLEKDRGRRYDTAAGLAQDVERYLADEPVQACPPSAAYRLRKFARRHRGQLLAAVLLGLALLVAAGAVAWAARDRQARSEAADRDRQERGAAAERDRIARRERVEARVGLGLEEVRAAYERDDIPDALARVGRVEAILADAPDVDTGLRDQVARWRAGLVALDRIDELRVRDYKLDPHPADADFGRVFHDLGIDVDGLPAEEAGRQIGARLAGQRLAWALDSWSTVRNEVAVRENFSAESVRRRMHLLRIALAADPDPLRNRVRLAQVTGDTADAERVARLPEALRMPPPSIGNLGMVLYWGVPKRGRESAIELLKAALRERPGSLGLNQTLANYLEGSDPPRWAEAAHFWEVALALRPSAAYVRTRLSGCYLRLGRVADAAAALAGVPESERLYPQYLQAVADVQNWSGDLDAAIASARRAVEHEPKNSRAHNQLGYMLGRKGEWRESVACVRKAIELDPTNHFAWSNLGVGLYRMGDRPGAIAALRRVMELNPREARSHYLLGVCLWETDRPTALDCLRRAAELDPKNVQAVNKLAEEHFAAGDRATAVAMWQKALAIDSKSAEAHANVAWALVSSPQPGSPGDAAEAAEALRHARAAVETGPKDSYRRVLGAAEYRAGNWTAAADQLRAEADRPGGANAWTWVFLAMAHWQLGQLEDGQKAYDRLVEAMAKETSGSPGLRRLRAEAAGVRVAKWPDRPEFIRERGEALLAAGEWQQALTAYTAVIDKYPQDGGTPWCYLGRALALSGIGKDSEGLPELNRAVERYPKLWHARVWRAAYYFDRGRWAESLPDYTRALELNPKYADGYARRGAASARLGRWADAATDLRRWCELAPADPAARDALARLLATCPDAAVRNPPLAVVEARKAVELAPAAGRYQVTLGVALYRADEVVQAERVLTAAIVRDGGSGAETWLYLAMVHARLGRPEAARQWHDRAAAWVAQNAPKDDDLTRLRDESLALLDSPRLETAPPPRAVGPAQRRRPATPLARGHRRLGSGDGGPVSFRPRRPRPSIGQFKKSLARAGRGRRTGG